MGKESKRKKSVERKMGTRKIRTTIVSKNNSQNNLCSAPEKLSHQLDYN
jgi:hypothetical protein